MFDNLSERLERSFKILKGEGRITEINIAETVKDIRKALLEADVNYKTAKQFTDQVKAKALGQNVMTAVRPGQLMVKITHDELANLVSGLQPLYTVACTPKANDRKPYLDAVKQCIEKMAPGTDLKTGQLDDILKRAMGINEPTPILRYPIMDVLDNQKVSDMEYRAILSEFKMNYEHLRSVVQNNTYKYKMKYNSITYYKLLQLHQ